MPEVTEDMVKKLARSKPRKAPKKMVAYLFILVLLSILSVYSAYDSSASEPPVYENY